ncbi:MAG TPA: DUF6600 domain-containing protein [Blastocatellia bacterium]|nr:DUF6600 domain-containing protein [Blastocatellia bacterium]
MKRALPFLTLLLVVAFAQCPATSLAQTPELINDQTTGDDDDAPVPRVARLSLIEGDVSFLRAGVTEWAAAAENLPLVAGDQLYVGPNSRAEIQLARGSYIRLTENTAVAITTLSDDAAQFELTEGIAIIRVERLSAVFKRFELDTPNSALLLQDDGLYRINVRSDQDSEVIVRNGAAEVSTEDGSFKVREGHRLTIDTSANGRLEIAVDTSNDDWDQWSSQRDVTINQTYNTSSPYYVSSYETNYTSFYGASDLSSYGDWFNDSDYGYCWRPRASYDWVPYRDGQWIWIPRAGWAWQSYEPWGWAPYHYGRWVFIPRYGWAWAPGIVVVRQYRSPLFYSNPFHYYRWRPALVYFFDCSTPRGNYVGWYPLAPHERWRRPDRYRHDGDHAHLRYPAPRDGSHRPGDGRYGIGLPRDRRGVSVMPVEGFTRPDRSRIRPVAPGQDVSEWINRSARPGLPVINPTPVAAAPTFRDGRERGARPIALPSDEVFRRPVVTRNRPPDSETGTNAPPRERRLINPHVGTISDGTTRRERRTNEGEAGRPKISAPGEQHGSDDNRDRRSRERIGVPSMPSNRNAGDNSERRRERRGGDETVTIPRPVETPRESDADNSRSSRRPNSPGTAPTPGDSNQTPAKPRDGEERRRERRPPWIQPTQPQDDAQPRNDARPRPRDDESSRTRDRNDSAPRAEPRHERPQPPPENRAETKQERHQEREERRQERREERRKP